MKIKRDVTAILNVAYLLCRNNIIFNLIPQYMQFGLPSGEKGRHRL